MKKIFFLSALAATAGLMTSCSSDEDIANVNTLDTKVISFATSQSVKTRSASTLSELDKFTVSAVSDDQTSFFSGVEYAYNQATGVFASAVPNYWPVTGNLSFYAINETGVASTDAVPSYTYTNWAGETDLVAATVISGEKTIPYPLTFQHLTSQIRVSAEAKDKTEALTYKLISVRMTTPSKGVYSFAAQTGGIGQWQIDNTSTKEYSFENALPLSFTETGSVITTDTYWNILPVTDGVIDFAVEYQVIQNSKVIADFTGSNVKGCTVTAPSLESGKRYVYNFQLSRGTNDEITFTTTVTDWDIDEVSDQELSDPSLTYVTYTDGTTKTFNTSGSISGSTYGNPGTSAFGTQSTVKSIRLSNQVTTLEPFAFSQFTSLERIYIPSSVTSIGQGAFHTCTSLKSGYVPACIKEIPANLFEACTSMENVSFADDITSIGHGAFNNCQSLKSFTVPNTVTEIGHQAFGYCHNMETITLSKNIEQIGTDAFIGNKSLKSITVPAENTHYASVDGVLYNGAKDTLILVPVMKAGSLSLPTSLKVIVNKAGENSHITSLSIPDGVEVGQMAFSGADNLATITFGADCKLLNNAFRQNVSNKTETNLQSVTFNGKATFRGYAVFWGCTKLSTITYNSTEAPEFDTTVIPSNYNGWSSTTATNAVGYETRSAGTNMFYVPAGATFTESDLEKSKAILFDSNFCGFTLSKTL